MDSSNEWHNESKEGALMINQYQKDTYDFDQTIKNIGKEMIKADDMGDEEKIKYLHEQGIKVESLEEFLASDAVDSDDSDDDIVNMQDYLQNKEKYVKAAKMSVEIQMFSQEVDFEMFETKFWGKNKGRLKLSALNVWTEIYSVIKGGINAVHNANCFYREDIIPWDTYIKMESSLEDSITMNEKHLIYLIYTKYEKWKKKHHYYDFMDVVRHVFKYFPSWNSKKLDYLVVDEVQDLAPLTIQLLLIATNENVFFCGDTAQTIAKGVTFRFYDLKPAFTNKKYLQDTNKNKEALQKLEPKVIQLTKNYRSHNNILQLANSIVDIIELYFPQTIDKLQRESSEKEGPKPIILDGFDHDDLEKLVMASSSSGTPKFGCNQVIIVRNQEMKNKIPFFMKKAL